MFQVTFPELFSRDITFDGTLKSLAQDLTFFAISSHHAPDVHHVLAMGAIDGGGVW